MRFVAPRLHYTFVSDFGRPSYLGVFENSRTPPKKSFYEKLTKMCVKRVSLIIVLYDNIVPVPW